MGVHPHFWNPLHISQIKAPPKWWLMNVDDNSRPCPRKPSLQAVSLQPRQKSTEFCCQDVIHPGEKSDRKEHLGFLGSFLGLSEMEKKGLKLGVSKNEETQKKWTISLG